MKRTRIVVVKSIRFLSSDNIVNAKTHENCWELFLSRVPIFSNCKYVTVNVVYCCQLQAQSETSLKTAISKLKKSVCHYKAEALRLSKKLECARFDLEESENLADGVAAEIGLVV